MNNESVGEAIPWGLNLLRRIAHSLYLLQGTGLPRIADWIRRRAARRSQRPGFESQFWIPDFMGTLNFRCDISDHMGSQIFFRGAYSADQLAFLKALLVDQFTFIDVGANQGEFSVYAASLSSQAVVLAFEPTQAMQNRLHANLSANDLDSVTVYPFGLSDRDQDNVPIYGNPHSYSDGTLHSGLPTLYSMSDREQVLEQISLRTLDGVLEAHPVASGVSCLKIDVEGAELSVLEGAKTTIATERPLIMMEIGGETASAAGYTPDDLYDWLESRDYTVFRIFDATHYSAIDPECEFCNVLAVPTELCGPVTDKLTRAGITPI